MKPLSRIRFMALGICGAALLCMADPASLAQKTAPEIPTIYVIGDSTAASYPQDRAPLTGWAMVLQEYVDPEKARVDNRARSGRSSKSYLDDGVWEPVRLALRKGDYVFIQFGHNDAARNDPNRYTEPQTTYKEYLTRYVNDARAQGAIPILFTSINYCAWNRDHPTRHLDLLGGYPEAVRELAVALEAPLVDLHQQTASLFNEMGPVKTRKLFLCLEPGESPNYPEGKEDTTHLQTRGAHAVAELAVEALRGLELPIAAYLDTVQKKT